MRLGLGETESSSKAATILHARTRKGNYSCKRKARIPFVRRTTKIGGPTFRAPPFKPQIIGVEAG